MRWIETGPEDRPGAIDAAFYIGIRNQFNLALEIQPSIP